MSYRLSLSAKRVELFTVAPPQLLIATVVVDGVMLPAEDKMMTSSTDEPVADDGDERIPVWIGKSLSQTRQW